MFGPEFVWFERGEGASCFSLNITSLCRASRKRTLAPKRMSILTPSESLAFNGFLSSVDYSDVLEWTHVGSDHLPVPLPPSRGKEALAKATKDLMSMEAPDLSFATGHHGIVDNEKHGDSSFMNSGPATTTQRSSANGSWPAFPSTAPRSNSHQYNYGFGAPGSTSSWSQPQFPIPGQLPHSHLDPSLRHHPQHQHQHQHQSPTSTSPSPFAFQEPYAQRLSPISQQSISTTGLSQTPGSTSKRSLDQSSSDPTSSSKRRRSSTATALDGDVDVNMRPPPIVTLLPLALLHAQHSFRPLLL